MSPETKNRAQNKSEIVKGKMFIFTLPTIYTLYCQVRIVIRSEANKQTKFYFTNVYCEIHVIYIMFNTNQILKFAHSHDKPSLCSFLITTVQAWELKLQYLCHVFLVCFATT